MTNEESNTRKSTFWLRNDIRYDDMESLEMRHLQFCIWQSLAKYTQRNLQTWKNARKALCNHRSRSRQAAESPSNKHAWALWQTTQLTVLKINSEPSWFLMTKPIDLFSVLVSFWKAFFLSHSTLFIRRKLWSSGDHMVALSPHCILRRLMICLWSKTVFASCRRHARNFTETLSNDDKISFLIFSRADNKYFHCTHYPLSSLSRR